MKRLCALEFLKSRIRQAGLYFCLVAFLAVIFLSGCGATDPQLSPEVSEGIGTMAQEKSRCEQSAALLKESKAPNSQEYVKGARLYIEAKSAFDGWIEKLKYDLVSGNNIAQSDYDRKLVHDAADKCAAFLAHVNETFANIETRGGAAPQTKTTTEKSEKKGATEKQDPTGVAVGKLITGLPFDSIIKLYSTYTAARKETREAILKKLDEQKWRPWQEIGASKRSTGRE
jgi:hypothetical protein